MAEPLPVVNYYAIDRLQFAQQAMFEDPHHNPRSYSPPIFFLTLEKNQFECSIQMIEKKLNKKRDSSEMVKFDIISLQKGPDFNGKICEFTAKCYFRFKRWTAKSFKLKHNQIRDGQSYDIFAIKYAEGMYQGIIEIRNKK